MKKQNNFLIKCVNQQITLFQNTADTAAQKEVVNKDFHLLIKDTEFQAFQTLIANQSSAEERRLLIVIGIINITKKIKGQLELTNLRQQQGSLAIIVGTNLITMEGTMITEANSNRHRM